MAVSQYYVDPSIAADSGTGTVGDPFGDLQYALDNITRNATDGDQININDTGTEELAAALDLSTYGTPTATTRLTLRGYTSAANDGGKGAISCNGYALFSAATLDYITLMDLNIAGDDSTDIIALDDSIHVINCRVNDCTRYGISLGDNAIVMRCTAYDCGTNGIRATAGGFVAYNRVLNVTGRTASYAYNVGNGTTLYANIMYSTQATAGGIATTDGDVTIAHNTIFTTSGSARGINISSSNGGVVIINNYIEGYSGGAGQAVYLNSGAYVTLYANNYFYNNTNTLVDNGVIIEDVDNVELSESAIYSPGTTAMEAKSLLKANSWPGYMNADSGAGSYRLNIDVGATQREEGDRRGRRRFHGV